MDATYLDILEKNTEILSKQALPEYEFIPQHERPLPSIQKLKTILDLLRVVVFPGYFGETNINKNSLRYHIGLTLDKLYHLLAEQIENGLSFSATDSTELPIEQLASQKALAFIDQIPELKRIISTDVKETYDGDPAAKSYSEIIFSYPTIRAVFNHRMAHELLKLGVPVIPRIISELAHSDTGIDIHPGAQIGDYFSIDHGTGVVIGETTIIGNHVRLYQGVTLGAKRRSADEKGKPSDGPRHPILEDGVVVYANANLFGRITIGRNSVIGGNVWLTYSVPPDSRILQQRAVELSFYDGLGI
ncbi:MAG: serine O-acetyltransferase EpsC [Bacteroidota bacterium]|nr:serine O-acetyltransferase EpsC [Bacteroidota bacterium]